MWKLKALVQSRRFWAAVAGVVAVALNETLGLDEAQAQQLGYIIIAWILGDSARSTGFGNSVFDKR